MTTRAEADPLIGSQEACELLGGIHCSTLKRWVEAGDLHAAQKLPGPTGGYLFTRAEIERRRKEIAA